MSKLTGGKALLEILYRSCPTWTTADGDVLKIEDVSNRHLQNIIAHQLENAERVFEVAKPDQKALATKLAGRFHEAAERYQEILDLRNELGIIVLDPANRLSYNEKALLDMEGPLLIERVV